MARTRPQVIVDRRIGGLQQIGEHHAAEAETGGFQNRPPAQQPSTVKWRTVHELPSVGGPIGLMLA